PDPGHPPRLGERPLTPGRQGRSAKRAPSREPLAIQFRELNRLYGIQLSFTDKKERRVRARRETALAVLRALGAPVERLEDVPDALRARRQELWHRRLEPVTVAWDGRLSEIQIRLPANEATRSIRSW